MFNKRLKAIIYKVIPEYNFLIVAIKKVYSRLLFLKSLLFKKDADAENKISARFVADQIKNNKVFLSIDFAQKDLAWLTSMQNILSQPNAPLIFYRVSEQDTEKFNYHPAEIMWQLADWGYSFFVLDKSGKIAPRQPRQYQGHIIASKQPL